MKMREEILLQRKKLEAIQDKEWYTVRSIFGNTWAFFFILLGGREAGKSYSTMDQFLKDWKNKQRPFTWLRLTEASTKKLLNNNGDKFIDPDLRRKYNLELTVKGC
jgi:phosphomevalonate kinase